MRLKIGKYVLRLRLITTDWTPGTWEFKGKISMIGGDCENYKFRAVPVTPFLPLSLKKPNPFERWTKKRKYVVLETYVANCTPPFLLAAGGM